MIDMTIHEIKAVPEICNEKAIAVLKGLLKGAEEGTLITVTGIAECRDGTYYHFGSATMSRLQTSGALLECAIKRLEDE